MIPILILFVLGLGLIHGVPILSSFGQGVREGIQTCLRIFPTMMLILISVSVFRASGALDFMIGLIAHVCDALSIPSPIVPLALMRPLSGGGSLSLCSEILDRFGADSLVGRIACVLSASTETTFYTLGIYLGGANPKGLWRVISAALICDVLTVLLSAWVCNLIF